MSQVNESIFRAYDIRGIVDEALSEEAVELIGKAFGSEVRSRGDDSVVIGRDGRLSGPRFVEALTRGITSTGCDVYQVGQVPTPVVYFAAQILKPTSCVAITGSHNPPNYNGLKMVACGETLSGDAIQGLYQRIVNDDFETGEGQVFQEDVQAQYIERIVSDIKLAKPLKVIVDAGNGVAGELAPKLLKALGCDVTEMYCEIDGTFPNHHPDPSKPENMKELIEAVKDQGADLGLAFDGDGDRLGLIDNEGTMIYADRQLMLYAQDVISRNPCAEIIYDVKCTSKLADIIEQAGGQPTMWRTGHSFIKAKLKETGALLAGEMSGHTFFKERWYGFDDEKVTTLDGIRVDFAEGWGLIRASNTTPVLVLRFDADNQAALDAIQVRFKELLQSVDANLALPF